MKLKATFYNYKLKTVLFGLLFLIVAIGCNESNNATTETPPVQNETTSSPTPSIIQMVGAINKDSLIEVCRENNIQEENIYQWKDHFVVYGTMQIDAFQNVMKVHFPQAQIKLFQVPFYNFNRQQHCNDSSVAKEWDNILLTANLVADTTLQMEYLTYHDTQFQKWPEVAQGFCNASFQQLLVYRDDRQLMLVISIPKGANLDELNPKTWENNPRVDEWNNRMKKYQEGIKGTAKGEVWVFLKPIKS